MRTKSLASHAAAALLAVAAGTFAPGAQAAEWMFIAGFGDKASVNKAGIGLSWDVHAPLWQGQTWQLRLLHEAEISFWDVPRASDIVEIGYTPLFRLQRGTASAGNWTPFVEAGIGVRLLSHTRVSDDRRLSTAFQFSDTLGAGVRFGAQGHSALGVRLQHLSNAGIKKPNHGMNFTQLYFQQRF